jgi:hypothetical protein
MDKGRCGLKLEHTDEQMITVYASSKLQPTQEDQILSGEVFEKLTEQLQTLDYPCWKMKKKLVELFVSRRRSHCGR